MSKRPFPPPDERGAIEAIIRARVGAEHVLTPVQDVVNRIERVLKRHYQVSADDRQWVERYVHQCHEDNRELYLAVMQGM